MKQTIISATLLSALTLPGTIAIADTTMYGSFRANYTLAKKDGGDRVSNMEDGGSRLGFKGGEDLGNGITLIFHLEWGFDTMEGASNGEDLYKRHAYIGLEGDWGAIRVGHTTNPFKDTVATDTGPDQFNGVGRASTMGAVNYAFWGGLDSTGNSRRSNIIIYDSPSFNGFSFNGAFILDNDEKVFQNKKHVDLWTLNGEYFHNTGLFVRLGYMEGYTRGASVENPNDNRKSKAWGGMIGYTSDPLEIVFAYSDAEMKSADFHNSATNQLIKTSDKAKGWDLGGRYSFGDNYDHSVYASYGQFEPKNEVSSYDTTLVEHQSEKQRAKTWGVGYQYKLSKRTRVWMEYEKVNYRHRTQETVAALTTHKERKWNNDTLSIGIRHDF